MATDSAIKAPKKPTARTRLGNGSALLPTTDGRSVWARLMRDTFEAVVEHMGGQRHLTEPKRMTARRIASLEAELVFLEDKFATARAEGREPTASDLDLYGRLANGQRRHIEAIGWDRSARDVTPDLRRYVEGKAA